MPSPVELSVRIDEQSVWEQIKQGDRRYPIRTIKDKKEDGIDSYEVCATNPGVHYRDIQSSSPKLLPTVEIEVVRRLSDERPSDISLNFDIKLSSDGKGSALNYQVMRVWQYHHSKDGNVFRVEYRPDDNSDNAHIKSILKQGQPIDIIQGLAEIAGDCGQGPAEHIDTQASLNQYIYGIMPNGQPLTGQMIREEPLVRLF